MNGRNATQGIEVAFPYLYCKANLIRVGLLLYNNSKNLASQFAIPFKETL